MSREKILYLGGFKLPDKNAAAHRVVANAKIMRELGYDVIFLGVRDDQEFGDPSLRRDESFFGFECWSVRYPTRRSAWMRYVLGLRAIVDFIKKLQRGSIAAVVFYNYPAIAQMRLSAQLRDRNIKRISDATEWYDASGGDSVFRLSKWLDTSLRMRFVNRHADGVITASRFLTEFYEDRGYPIVELPTLYDTETFAPPSDIQDHEVRKFIFVGTPFIVSRVSNSSASVKERLDICIQLFFDLHEMGENFVFDVYGVTKDAYLSVYPQHLEMLNVLKDRVIFHGRKPHAHVIAKVAASDVSIFFRDKTRVTLAGFPSKFAESISCGTPVVSNRAVNLEPYEGRGWIILTDENDRNERVKELINLSGRQIYDLKTAAFESRLFDFRRFQKSLVTFFDAVGI